MSMLFSGSYDEDFMKNSEQIISVSGIQRLENDNQYLKRRIDELEQKMEFIINYISENDSKFRQLFNNFQNSQNDRNSKT